MIFYRRLLETAFLTVRNNQNQLGKPEGGDEEGLTSWAGGWLLVARSAEVTRNSESGDRSASGDGPGKSNKQHDRANYGERITGQARIICSHAKLNCASRHSHATWHERDLFPLCCLVRRTADHCQS